MSDTTISWTNKTWNPTVGCSRVSDGCRRCYAERTYRRFHKGALPWTAENAGVNVHCIWGRLPQPSHWRKPAMVFVDSMSDLFHEKVPDDFISSVWNQMRNNDRHTYQILTKRPKRMLEWVGYWYPRGSTPPSNIWLGVSTENQIAADERIPLLLQTPAAVRFLSCEPLLGSIDLKLFDRTSHYYCDEGTDDDPTPAHRCKAPIDWVIVGGESGPGYRPMDLDWARAIRDQCRSAGVPFFFKQESGLRPGTNAALDGKEWKEFPSRVSLS